MEDVMARAWETTEVKEWDPRDKWYSKDTRRQDALNARRFRVDSFEEHDMRRGSARKWMTCEDLSDLAEEYRILNNYEGLLD
jgi:hypothetical protein